MKDSNSKHEYQLSTITEYQYDMESIAHSTVIKVK